MGMVGGGRGAFIGGVHRRAANLDGQFELVAGAFSSDPKKSKLSGKDFYVDPKRTYASYQEMAEKEAALPENERIDFVTIVVQNYLHFEVAKTFLEAGFNVICDKPVTYDLEQARELRKIIKKSKKVFALTHNYTGYPMVKLARNMVKKGELGEIIKIVCEYPQGYAITALTGEDKAIANWRADPKVAGISNCMGDIGTHAENLVHYVTGLEIDKLCADLSVNIPGRTLDDDGNVLVRFKGGAKGIIYASQVSNGDENDLNMDWLEIARQSETLHDAATAMGGTPWGSAVSDIDSDAMLQEYEDALDRHYYHEAISALRTSGQSHSLLLGYLRSEIDHRNIVNLLRALRQKLPTEQRAGLMLEGGRYLKGSLLRSAAQADSEDALMEVLRRTSMETAELEDALKESNEHGGLDPVVSHLASKRRADLRRMSHLNPLSAFPLIYYLESKVLEVQNLRLLVRGKAVGLSDEVIEAHMAF